MTDTAHIAAAPNGPATGLSPAEPDGAPRNAAIDILRGLAILAILFMNIDAMGGSFYVAIGGDLRQHGWTGADQAAWWTREIFLYGTARALLEMLFGVGMVILTDRAAASMASKWQVMRAYWWRNFVLFVFGIVHLLILLWPGDILHTYGLAAMLAVLFRRWRPRWLITFGLLLAMLQLVGGGIGAAYMQSQAAQATALRAQQAAGRPITAEQRKQIADADKGDADRAKRKAENASLTAADNAARSGSARTWVQASWDATWWVQSRFLELLFVWEALATMLIGAALFKLGIVQGARSRGYYLRLTAITYAIGFAMRAWIGWEITRFDGTMGIAGATSEVARLLVTVGHIGLVNLLLMSAAGTRLLRPFEAAGKTALTIYILQTVVCLWILYPPWGLALYGDQSWATFMLTALLVNAALLWWANWWLRRYKIAPVEWAWRSIVEGRRLPFRRGEPAGQGAPAPLPA